MRFWGISHMHSHCLNMNAQLSSGPRSVNFDRSLHRDIYFVYVVKALVKLHICTGSPEPSLLEYTISSKIS